MMNKLQGSRIMINKNILRKKIWSPLRSSMTGLRYGSSLNVKFIM